MKRLFLAAIALLILSQPLVGFQAEPTDAGNISIVVLKQPAVASRLVERFPGGSPVFYRRQLNSSETLAYRRVLQDNQQRLAREVGVRDRTRFDQPAASDLEILDQQDLLLNALFVRGTAEGLNRLRNHPDVEAIFPNQVRSLLLDGAPSIISAAAVWSQLGGISNAGQGIRIGVIDSGININHPMFQDSSLTAPAGFPIPGQIPGFTNGKVIVARTYVDPKYGMQPQDDKTPRDELSHGSQVAGVAAGAQVQSPQGLIHGIAPKAYLGIYKVFGSPSNNGTTTSTAVIAALNDALADGMQVVNLSLGGSPRNPETDPEQQAIKRLVDLGVVVVVAAGNAGPNAASIRSPGTSPEAITVGATSHSRIFTSQLVLSSGSPSFPEELESVYYVPGSGDPILNPVGPLPLASIASLDVTEQACNTLPAGSLNGKVALVLRGGSQPDGGSCFFTIKANNVLNVAGAVGMVVYNNVDGPAISMGFGNSPPSRPAVMIEKAAGEMLSQLLQDGVSISVTFRPQSELVKAPVQPDLLTSFSSRGPSIDEGIKPDLSAPGQDIYTADGNGSDFEMGANGTSFATPMVSGAAALLRQLRPSWTVRQIKSALVNTADDVVRWNQADATFQQGGNGRLNMALAAAAKLAADPVSVSFGTLVDRTLLTRSVSISKLPGNSSGPVRVRVQPSQRTVDSQTRVRVAPGSFLLDGNATVTLQIELQVPDTPLVEALEASVDLFDDSGNWLMRIPVWASLSIGEAFRTLRVAQQGGTSFSTLTAALSAARPGDTIEITDSGTYAGAIQIQTGAGGLLLNGLTLRSAPGQTPVIMGTSSDEAALQVTGLRDVRIEGLALRGARRGIRLQDSRAVLVDNLIEQNSVPVGEEFNPGAPGSGVVLENSEASLYRNEIRNNGGIGVAIFGSSALIQDNQIGDPGAGNGEHGIFASVDSFLAVFDSSVEQNGRLRDGQGIRISGTQGLVKGTLISGTQGSLGDGLLIRGNAKVRLQDSVLAGNQRIGIWIREGATAELQRTTVADSGFRGVFIEDSLVEAAALSIVRNLSGIRLLADSPEGARLVLQDSVVADTSDGPGIDVSGGRLQLFNSTLYGHAGTAVQVEPNGAVDVRNAIFSANGGGDLSGAGTDSVQSSLVTEASLAGVNGNFTGDPKFANPALFDFSLQDGSDAIDKGVAEVPSSAGDLLGHQRSVDGNGDGIAVPDAGAVEFASQGTKPVVLPILSTEPGEFVGLAVANGLSGVAAQGDPVGARISLRGFTLSGQPFGQPFEAEVPAGSQLSILLQQAIGPLQPGWVEIRSDRPGIVSFTLLGTDDLRFLDGSELGPARSKTLIFTDVNNGGGEQTRIHLVNPNQDAQSVTVTWFSQGQVLASRIFQIPGNGALSGLATELLGVSCPASPGACNPGYMVAQGEKELQGMEIFGTPNSRGGLPALAAEQAGPDWVGAQLASALDVETFVNLVNLGDGTLVTLTARNEAGEVVGEPLVREMGSGESIHLAAAEAFGFTTEQVGWLEVHAPFGRVLGSVRYSDASTTFLAALPLQDRGAREFLLSHIAQTNQIFTGVTLLNPDPVNPAVATIEAFDAEGSPKGLAFVHLGPLEKKAQLLFQWIKGFSNQAGGFLRIRSTIPLVGFELFGDSGLEYLSSVPQQVTAW